ncbi:metallophosphoesterase [Cellulomonas sp. NS3]|uniref:metallophosphoesterase n=1 Tax=Cellulomonas sp. NS3 TaxID=2973977 RepID=UPI002163BD7A|nr:metallophosphoesterase [Cellulomonas sp. NS3]
MSLTSDRTVERGEPDARGWRPLVTGPGEPHLGGVPAAGGRVLGALVHMSDPHLCDAESPARQEHLDRHGDPGAPYAPLLGTIGTYRAQEILTAHVAAAALAAVQRLHRAPVAGAPLDAVVVTGDLVDNAQRNELRWYTDLLAGRPVAPRSGDPARSSWVGATDPGRTWWPQYWHPDGPPDGVPDDVPTARHGFPRLPGIVDAARQAVASPGAGLPWHSVHGNHDALLQGVVAPDDALRALAVGAERVVDLAPGQTPFVVLDAAATVGPARYTHTPESPREPVPPDAGRDLVEPGDVTGALAAAEPDPGALVARYGNAWVRDVGELRLIAMDTANPHGGYQGSVDAEQLAWLDEQLTAAADRYVVVLSHHPSWTLLNAYAPDGEPRRHRADDVLGLLLRHRCVIAWLAGHVHAHTHRWHPGPDGRSGLFEITTASLIDWPQQLRVVEVVREPGGTLAITSTVVDHAGAGGWTWEPGCDDVTVLAGVSRTLAANDWRVRARPELLTRAAGAPADRNAVWRMPDPHA